MIGTKHISQLQSPAVYVSMAVATDGQQVTLGIVSPLGPGLDVMNLQMPMAAAQLAGKVFPPEYLDHNFFLAPCPPRRIGVFAILMVFHAGVCTRCSSPMPVAAEQSEVCPDSGKGGQAAEDVASGGVLADAGAQARR